MAAADYYLCDVCEAKTFYDADVNWDVYESRIGGIKCICSECSKRYRIAVVPTDDHVERPDCDNCPQPHDEYNEPDCDACDATWAGGKP